MEWGALAIAEALKFNAVLTNMNIQGNDNRADGAKALAEALKVNRVLTNLNISKNQICGLYEEMFGGIRGTYDASGIKVLAEALNVSVVLTTLEFSGNSIGKEVQQQSQKP